jgi:hypothetical protein
MAKKTTIDRIGMISFLVGIVAVFILGIIEGVSTFITPSWTLVVLFIAGISIGILNIMKKEITMFIVSTIALTMFGFIGISANLPAMLGDIIDAIGKLLLVTIGPAMIVAAIKGVLTTATRKKITIRKR